MGHDLSRELAAALAAHLNWQRTTSAARVLADTIRVGGDVRDVVARVTRGMARDDIRVVQACVAIQWLTQADDAHWSSVPVRMQQRGYPLAEIQLAVTLLQR